MSDKVLADEAVRERLEASLPHWRLENGAIRRRYRTHGWKGTLMVVNAVGHLAEAAFHHPDLVVSYASVEVALRTHSAKGITEKDLALARRIEEVVTWRPGPRDGGLGGPPEDPRHAYLRPDG